MLIAVPVWALYSVLLKRRPADLSQLPLLAASIGIVLAIPFYL